MSAARALSGLAEIPVELIDESPSNPRKHFDEEALRELAHSIVEKGVLEPVLVRPRGRARYELVAGARRLRASKAADLATIPAIVRELDDRQVLEIQLVENNQREDVSPIEEADALLALHEKHNRSIEDLAAQLGRSNSYVALRLALARAPSALRDMVAAEQISLAAMNLVLRAPASQLEGIVERVLRVRGNAGRALTRKDVQHIVGQFVRALDGAPFALDDAKLTKRGACTSCPSRTGAQRGLFGEADADDRCLDADCYAAKVEAVWARAKKDARKRRLAIIEETYEGPWRGAGLGHREASAKAIDVASQKTWGELVSPTDIVIAREEDGRVIELVTPAAIDALKAAWRAERAAGGRDPEADEEDDVVDEGAGVSATPANDWRLASDERFIEGPIAEFAGTLRRLEAIGERTLLEWLVRRTSDGRRLALRRTLIEPGASPEAAEAQLQAWAETATNHELLLALAEDLLWAGVVDDEVTFDGLLEADPQDATGEGEDVHG